MAAAAAPNRFACGSTLLPQPLEDRRHMHLIGLVVARQRIHHEVDAEAVGHLPLPLAARDGGEHRSLIVVESPGAGPVVAADDDAGDAVVDPVLALLDPDLAIGPAARKRLHQ